MNEDNFNENNSCGTNSRKSKSKITKIIMITISIMMLCVVGVKVIPEVLKEEGIIDNTNVNDNNSGEENKTDIKIVCSDELLKNAFQNGELTTDEYVQNMLYLEYDENLLDPKYKMNEIGYMSDIDKLVDEYYDELSYETLRYYAKKINLDGITFELDVENEDEEDDNKFSFSTLLTNKVYAKKEKVTNLNQVVLSKNGNFVVWYTTTGKSKTDYNTAKKVADGLERTIEIYKNQFGCDYKFKSYVESKGSTYKKQAQILKKASIDESYLENAMQIYLVEYTHSSAGKYLGRTGALIKVFNAVCKGDENGAIIKPYILIKPSAFSDFERLEQLYNHELFHHYQYEVLRGESYMGSDPYIGEASANWASALATEKTTNYGYLNEWAGTYKAYADKLLSQEMIKEYDEGTLGYALFVYLYNYSKFVEDGNSKIINSIYSDNFLEYLTSNATFEELALIQENIVIQSFQNNYENKNVNSDNDAKIPYSAIITQDKNEEVIEDVVYSDAMFVESRRYYCINDNSDYIYNIQFLEDTRNPLLVTIIKYSNNKYSVVDTSLNKKETHDFNISDDPRFNDNSYKNIMFNTADYGKYDCLYIVVSNIYAKENSIPLLRIKEIKARESTIDDDLEQGEEIYNENDIVYFETLNPINKERYTGNEGDSFIDIIGTRNGNQDIYGASYEHGLTAWVARWNFKNESSWVWNEYDLDGKYEKLCGDIVQIKSYNQNNFNTEIKIIGDGEVLYSKILTPDNLPIKNIKVDVSGVKTLKILLQDLKSVSGGTAFGLANFKLIKLNALAINKTEANTVDKKNDNQNSVSNNESISEDYTIIDTLMVMGRKIKFKTHTSTYFWNSNDNFGAGEIDTVFFVSKNGLPIQNYYEIEKISGIIFQNDSRFFNSQDSVKKLFVEWHGITDLQIEELKDNIFSRHIKGETDELYVEIYCMKYNNIYYAIELDVYKNNYSKEEIDNIISEYYTIINTLEINEIEQNTADEDEKK